LLLLILVCIVWYNATSPAISDASYTANFYCNDTSNNWNSSESVGFIIDAVSDVVAVTTSASSGGGGGAVPVVGANYIISENSMKIRSVIGDLKTREFIIENTGEIALIGGLSVEGEEIENGNGEVKSFDKIVVLDKNSFSLGINEKENIGFKIIVPESLGVYTGKIIINAGGIKKEILIMINTQSKETLFDISSTLINEEVKQGDKLKTQMYLLPVGEKGVDVTIKYLIKDFKGEIYSEESNTFYVDKEISFVQEFDVRKLAPGNYVLASEMTYVGGFASASSQFEVLESGSLSFAGNISYLLIVIIVFVVFVFGIVLVKLIKIKKYKKTRKRRNI